MRENAAAAGNGGLFQSTPDREAGRCQGLVILLVVIRRFQSTPDREAGRCRMHPLCRRAGGMVSIHARP